MGWDGTVHGPGTGRLALELRLGSNGEERIIRMRAKSGQVLDDVTGKGKVLGET